MGLLERKEIKNMATQTVVQNPDGTQTIYVKPDVIGIVGEIVGCIGGLAAGGFVGVQIAKAIGPVYKTVDKVGKAVLIGSASLATEYYVSEAISNSFDQISEISDWGAEKIKARSQHILQEEVGQVQNPGTQQRDNKKQNIRDVRK